MWLKTSESDSLGPLGMPRTYFNWFSKEASYGVFWSGALFTSTMNSLNRHCPRQASLAKPCSLRKTSKSPAVRELTQQYQETLRPGGGQVG